ncbi:MAG: ABC transporter permease [Deltaproteobacteria bacterium]|nr:ABC transporter permease [Deltaproteobacteria bacterium]
MNIVSKIASRFVFDRKDDEDPIASGFVSFISAISVTGLALGVTALLVVTSVMNGFEREMKSALTAFHGHILLFSRAEPLADPEKFLGEIPKNFPDVTAVSPYLYVEAMLSSAKGVAGAVIEGVHRPTLDSVSQIARKVVAGRLPEPHGGDVEVALGFEVARKLKASVGDTVVLTIPFAGKSSSGRQAAKKESRQEADSPSSEREGSVNATPLVRRLKVVGIVRLGMYDYDVKYALAEIGDLQKALDLSGRANAFKILTKDARKSIATANAMNERYAYPMRARDWSSLNRNLFYAIELEKVVISIILMAIVLVASFNIISTLMMLVHDKKRQIAMLKALGFRARQTLSVFLIVGMGMTVLGVVLGLGLGRALCALLSWKSIIDLPADVYGLSRLPVEIRISEWALICAMVIVLAAFSTLWPSIRVSRQRPVEGLHHE